MHTGKKWNSIKNILVIFLLAALTFSALELQRQYYDRADERLFSQVMLNEYSVTVVNEKVGIEQKIDALRGDDSIIAEGNEEYSADELETYRNNIISELDNVLMYGWRDWFFSVMQADDLQEHLHEINVLRVDDDKLYSFSLGIYEFWNKDGYLTMEPSAVLFDMESGKILYMQMFSNENVFDMYGYYVNADSYDIVAESYSYETDMDMDMGLLESQYCVVLSDYYNMEMDSDAHAAMGEYYLTVSPYTNEEVQGDTFSELFDIIYRDYNKWFY